MLVCGSRDWVDPRPIEDRLRSLPPGTTIIHGACRGVDNIAGDIASRLGFTVRSYPVPKAVWDKYGPPAGNMRNALMLKKEHPRAEDGTYVDLILAFHEDPSLGKGTRDMVGRGKKAVPEINVEIILRAKHHG